jgi:hypothetical protein
MANLPHANMAKKRIQPACSQPAASLQPACSQPAAAAAALPPRARARRCRLPGNILAGVAAYTNAPQRVRFISYIYYIFLYDHNITFTSHSHPLSL